MAHQHTSQEYAEDLRRRLSDMPAITGVEAIDPDHLLIRTIAHPHLMRIVRNENGTADLIEVTTSSS